MYVWKGVCTLESGQTVAKITQVLSMHSSLVSPLKVFSVTDCNIQ